MTKQSKGTALVTGASSGIGAAYAERLVNRGHDLILVARNQGRLDDLAGRLRSQTGRNIDVVRADLGNSTDLRRIEGVLRGNPHISVLVNNAGIGSAAALLDSDVDRMEAMITLNITALTRLTYAVAPALASRGAGTIINIASIVGIAPELLNGVYGGTKAFVLAFTQSLHKELAGKGIRVQAVLPGAIATEFWDVAGVPISQLPPEWVMQTSDLVDASLAGFDQGELVTIPSLPNLSDWNDYEVARQKLLPNLSRKFPAARYRKNATDFTTNQASATG